jgi:hypothetical protein
VLGPRVDEEPPGTHRRASRKRRRSRRQAVAGRVVAVAYGGGTYGSVAYGGAANFAALRAAQRPTCRWCF